MAEDSWEEAYESEEFFNFNIKKRQNIVDSQFKIFIQITKVLQDIVKDNIKKETFIAIKCIDKEPVLSNKIMMINKHLMKFDEYKTNDSYKNLLIFKVLSFLNIYSRIYVSFDDNDCFECTFIEYFDGKILREPIIEKNYEKRIFTKHFYISIDFYMNIVNHTLYLSNSIKHYKFFDNLVNKDLLSIQNIIFSSFNQNLRQPLSIQHDQKLINTEESRDKPHNDFMVFKDEDNKRAKVMPKSKVKFKYHSFFTIESLLSRKYCIFPKNRILGYFKGEPVYSISQKIKLMTEKEANKIGKKIKDDVEIPFRFIKIDSELKEDLKLYAPWQIEDIFIESLQMLKKNRHKYAEYLHENHIPRDSVYINNQNCSIVCKRLNLSFMECLVGFDKKNPVIKGVFIEKKYENIIQIFLKNIDAASHSACKILKINKILDNWKNLKKTIEKYIRITKRLQ